MQFQERPSPAFDVSHHCYEDSFMLGLTSFPGGSKLVQVSLQRVRRIKALLYIFQGVFGRPLRSTDDMVDFLVSIENGRTESTIFQHTVKDVTMGQRKLETA
jgi:hypothetical protein